MADRIPIEIQMEIVKRVPVKSLFQFRSVSKSWKSLIDSPLFIADYNACESRPQRLLIRYKDEPKSYSSVCIVDDDIFPQNKFPGTLRKISQLTLVGSSEGLLCLLADYRSAFIWNPAIRKSISIEVFVLYERCLPVLGFGVCPNTNEPMLVKLIDYDIKMFWRVKVFKLNSRVWRRPRSKLLPHRSISFAQSQVAINGFIYWQTYNRLIVSFDMTSEEFAEINLPRNFRYPYTKDLSIFNLRESLAVLEYYKDAGKPVCAVSMMEHGVPNSFTKLFTVTTPNACLTKVLGFRKNGEVIVEVNDRDDCYGRAVLKVYEPRSELICKDLGIQEEHGSFFVASYKETLLLLDQPPDHQVIKMKSWSRKSKSKCITLSYYF